MPLSELWGTKRWGSFKWGITQELSDFLNAKSGSQPIFRIIWKLDGGDQDITAEFLSGGLISQEKERAPDRITAGDMQLVFDNTSDKFTEINSNSILNGEIYHNKNITFEVGFQLSDGTIDYILLATMKVRELMIVSDNSTATIKLYDQVQRFLDEKINRRPDTMIGAFNSGNTGNGTITDIDTKPFVNVSQDWTLTCTTGGGDGTAEFSVVGSVSGNIGTATSGTEFSNNTTGGIKFTIEVGDINWAIDDIITFSTVQMMEWTALNPANIIWSILTGTKLSDGTDEDWKTRTPELDSTRTPANTDINYGSIISSQGNITFTVTGFIPWDFDLVEALEEINVMFLGALNIDPRGRVKMKVFRPEWAASPTEFSDSKKNTSFSYKRNMQDMVNRVSIKYRKTNDFPFSDEDDKDSLNGLEVQINQTSRDDFGQWFQLNFENRYYNADADHVTYMGTRLIDKYGRPPIRFIIKTGLDAVEIEPGDIISGTDVKSGYSNYPVEVMAKESDMSAEPKEIILEAEDTGVTGISWCFLGSSGDEGDGISPQTSSYDDATDIDKTFCYLSQTGGSGTTGPDYFLF